MNDYGRGLIIFLLTVPISFISQKFQLIRNKIFNFFSTPRNHDKKVQIIQKKVAETYRNKQKMCTARRPWQAMSLRIATYKASCVQIPVNLKNILHFDKKQQTISVEPLVTMKDLTDFLVPKGFALAVHPEMDDLTIGGLCMGVGIETTSHQYGFLYETIEAFEIIIADGSLLRVSRSENSDLFHALPWSHGTLGFLVAVLLKVVPVKQYMKLEYIPCHSQKEFCHLLQKLTASANPPPYIEGLVFSSTKSVVMCGTPTDITEKNKRCLINPINRWYKKWFYSHVEHCLTNGPKVELIPMAHYFHRHTPSLFFQLKELIPFANSSWYRYLFAWLGAPKVSLIKRHSTKQLRRKSMFNRVTQDIIIPITDMDEALDFCHANFKIYPLWICPVRLFDHGNQSGFIRNPEKQGSQNSHMFVDIGIYGIPNAIKEKQTWDMITVSRALETFTINKKGYHLLYADIFMNKSEFEKMFDHHHYRAMRRKYYAESAFPEVYEKIIPELWLYKA